MIQESLIVDIKTEQYSNDERATNVKHIVSISFDEGDHTKVTKTKEFINDIEGLLTFIVINKNDA